MLDAIRIRAVLVDLVDGNDDRHFRRAGVVDRFDRLRHDAVVRRHHEDDDVGDVRATGAHRGERCVSRGVDERDEALRRLHLVGADVLGDATRLARGHLGGADVVEQRRLAVVDVTHDGHDRRTRQHFDIGRGLEQLLLDLVFLQRDRRVAEFLDDERGGVLVDGLVDRGHHAHLHHRLDDFVGLDRHAVGELADRDGLRDLHVTLDRRGGLHETVARLDLHLARTAVAAGRLLLLLEARLGVRRHVEFLASVLGRGARCLCTAGRRLRRTNRLRRTRGLRRATFGVGALALALGAVAGLLFGGITGIGFGARSRGFFQHTPLVRFDAIALELFGGTTVVLRAFVPVPGS